MINRILSEFQESILSQVAYDKMELSRRVITRDDANYKCSIEETGVLANMSETGNRLSYYFGDSDSYYNRLTVDFCTGEKCFTVSIIVGKHICHERITSSKLLTHDYSFDNREKYRSRLSITEELLEEYGADKLQEMLVREICAFISEVEEKNAQEEISKYNKLVEEFTEKRNKVRGLLDELLEVKAPVKVCTKEDIINKINNTTLTQEQINNINELVV